VMGYLIDQRSKVTVLWLRKSGCTFLMNTFYYLNTGKIYPEPVAISGDKKAVVHFRYTPRRFGPRDENKSFVVLRHPFSRFLSFYWDKIYSKSPYVIVATRKHLVSMAQNRDPGFSGFDLAETLSLDGHIANLHGLLNALEENLTTKGYKIDTHYQRQSSLIEQSGGTELPIVRLDEIDRSLPGKICEACPELPNAIKKMPRMNESPKVYPDAEMLTPEFEERLAALYSADLELYKAASA